MTEPTSNTPTIEEEREGLDAAFRTDLKDLINTCCMENGSDTPDFILATYMMSCLEAFNTAMTQRTAWYRSAYKQDL